MSTSRRSTAHGAGQEPYSAAKAGLINLTQNLAIKYGQYGVRITMYLPRYGAHPNWAAAVAQDPQIFRRQTGRLVSSGPCPANPKDIANAALFLASDEASGSAQGRCSTSTAASWRATTACRGDCRRSEAGMMR
ncbi:MAG: SDR family oxidoreductase [Caldilineaceae bacterium]